MTVQVQPAEAEADQSSTNKKQSVEQRMGIHNLINLWDEHIAADQTKSDKPRRDRKAD